MGGAKAYLEIMSRYKLNPNVIMVPAINIYFSKFPTDFYIFIYNEKCFPKYLLILILLFSEIWKLYIKYKTSKFEFALKSYS